MIGIQPGHTIESSKLRICVNAESTVIIIDTRDDL